MKFWPHKSTFFKKFQVCQIVLLFYRTVDKRFIFHNHFSCLFALSAIIWRQKYITIQLKSDKYVHPSSDAASPELIISMYR